MGNEKAERRGRGQGRGGSSGKGGEQDQIEDCEKKGLEVRDVLTNETRIEIEGSWSLFWYAHATLLVGVGQGDGDEAHEGKKGQRTTNTAEAP